jgi:hypothetical protein
MPGALNVDALIDQVRRHLDAQAPHLRSARQDIRLTKLH